MPIGRSSIALLLGGLASWGLSSTPSSVLMTAPLVYATLDDLGGGGQRSAPWFVRVGARLATSCLWGVATYVSMGSHPPHAQASSWPLFALTLALLLGTLLAPLAVLDRELGARAPLVCLVDVTTTAWLLLCALIGQPAPWKLRAVVVLVMAMGLLVRSRCIRPLRHVHSPPAWSEPTFAALGFVGWIGADATACVLSPTTWAISGLGAALVLTLSALWVERRRRRPTVFFLRSSLAFCTATMLTIATWLRS